MELKFIFFSLRCWFLCMTLLDVTSPIVKTSVKFWGTSFNFWLRPCYLYVYSTYEKNTKEQKVKVSEIWLGKTNINIYGILNYSKLTILQLKNSIRDFFPVNFDIGFYEILPVFWKQWQYFSYYTLTVALPKQ